MKVVSTTQRIVDGHKVKVGLEFNENEWARLLILAHYSPKGAVHVNKVIHRNLRELFEYRK